jgi:DedD protein
LASRSLAAKTPLPPPAEAVKPESAPEKAPEKAPTSTAPAQPTAVAKSVETPVVKPVDKAEKPADKPAAAKAEATRAAAALNGVPTEEQWVVLLGAYKEPANVKQLTNKLKQMGLPSFSEHFDSPQGPRTRVRAGPFKARDAAEKALARIKTIGVDGQVAQSK